MIRSLLVIAVVGLAAPAWPCSVETLPSAERLIADAEVILRVRADAVTTTRPDLVLQGMEAVPTQVRFAILEVVKGRLSSSTIEFRGGLTEHDDRNGQSVPYTFVRPQGRGGNCFALTYRNGAEYLLMLGRGAYVPNGQPNELTPSWAPLSPTNEQLFGGANDAWLVWVKQQLRPRER